MAYKPSTPFTVPMKILIPEWRTVNGVRKKVFPDVETVPENLLFFGSFRTFGGTETEKNGVYGIENTAIVETWFRPELAADCRIVLMRNGAQYEIVGEPENIELRNQYLKFKVKQVAGKA